MIEELLRGRPAVLVAIALGIGIAIASEGNVILIPIATMVLIALASIVIWRRAFFSIVLLFVAFMFLGQQLTTLDSASYKHTNLSQIASMKPTKPVVVGTLEEIDETNTEYLWIFETDSISIDSQTPIAIHGLVLLRLPKNDREHVPLPA